MRQLIILSIFITGLSLLACSHKMSGSIATASVVQDTIDPSKVDKVIDYSIKQEFKSAKQLSQLICDTWSKRINEKPSYSLKRCMDARDESHVLDSLDINLVGDTIYMYEFDDLVDGFSAFYWNSRNEFDVLPRNGEASMSAERSEYEFYPNLKMGIEKWNKKHKTDSFGNNIMPNAVSHVFKARYNRYGMNIKIWHHVDRSLGTMIDMFATTWDNKPLTDDNGRQFELPKLYIERE